MKEANPYQPELDPIDWRTSSRRARNAIVRHVPLILLTVAVTYLLLFAYVRLFPPVFRAEAVVQAEPDSDTGRVEYYAHWNMFRKVDMKSEPELLTSGRVAKLVVEDLKLKFDDVHHTMLTQIGYLWTESLVGRKYRAFKEWLFPPDPALYRPTPEEIEFGRTVDSFRDGIKVEQVAGTTVARVVVQAPSYRAAEIANRTVDIFLAERR
ncbi:MAG TPA: Wzz/FepE/Etk N-terminal domain-containing protein, partial [Kiritimatiellia bacterium]